MQPRQRSRCGDHRVRELAAGPSLVHQHDAPARRVHLLAPQHVGGAGRQAEAAVHAVVDEVGSGRSRRSPSGHQIAAHEEAGVAHAGRVEAAPSPGAPASSAGVGSCHGSSGGAHVRRARRARTQAASARSGSRSRSAASAPPGGSVIQEGPSPPRPTSVPAERVGGAQGAGQVGRQRRTTRTTQRRRPSAGPRAGAATAPRRPRRPRPRARARAARRGVLGPRRPSRRRSAASTAPRPSAQATSRHSSSSGRGPARSRRRARARPASSHRARARSGVRGQRVQPHGDLDDQPQRAERAGEQLGQVVAGDVLDHLAARPGDRAVGERDGDAQHQVARARRSGGAAGPSRRWRPRPPTVAAGRAERRIEREHLARRRRTRSWARASGTPGLEDGGQVARRCAPRTRCSEPEVSSRRRARSASRGPSSTSCRRRESAASPARRRTATGRLLGECVGASPRRGDRATQNRSATPAASSGCSPVRARHLAAQPRRGHDLAGVGEPLGIERAAQPLERVQVGLVEHQRHVALLVDADAVLAGDRAAGVDAGREDQRRRAPRPARPRPPGAVVADERVEVAVAGVEHVGDLQAVLGGELVDPVAAPRGAGCAGSRRPGRSSWAPCGPSPRTPPCAPSRSARARPRPRRRAGRVAPSRSQSAIDLVEPRVALRLPGRRARRSARRPASSG